MNNTKRRSTLAYLQVAVAASALGTWSLFLRPAGVDPHWSATIVLLVVAILPAPLLLKASAHGPSVGGGRKRSEWWSILLLAIFAAGNALLYFTAMKVGSVAGAVLSHCFTPVIVAVFAPWVLGTPRRWRTLVLALVALFGIALTLEPWRASESGLSAQSMLIGVGWGFGAALFNSGALLVNKRIESRFTTEERLVYPAVVAGALLLVPALFLRAGALPTPVGAAWVVAGGATAGAVGGLLFLRGLKGLPAEHAGVLTLIEPLTGLMIAWLIWGERFGIAGIAGAALVVISGVLVLREPADDSR